MCYFLNARQSLYQDEKFTSKTKLSRAGSKNENKPHVKIGVPKGERGEGRKRERVLLCVDNQRGVVVSWYFYITMPVITCKCVLICLWVNVYVCVCVCVCVYPYMYEFNNKLIWSVWPLVYHATYLLYQSTLHQNFLALFLSKKRKRGQQRNSHSIDRYHSRLLRHSVYIHCSFTSSSLRCIHCILYFGITSIA